jgi:AcrR family transcriptional regulator
MPRLWNNTIETHRRTVHEAILDAAAALVGEFGLRGVTMSAIAERTGVGRATLYKYFPDVEAILLAWHERKITGHLEHLARVRDQTKGATNRLKAVLEAYAFASQDSRRPHGHADAEPAAVLHRDLHVARAHKQLHDMIRDLVVEGGKAGELRDDVSPDELASYCLYAVAAAGDKPSKAAVHRLVAVILDGLHAP